MAGHQRNPPVRRQKLGHQRAARSIEIIGRLVQQDDPRPVKKRRRQRRPALLPAGKLG
ncbi:hypothetical protein [Marinovum algicola]|uniref:hypothetical protein n=1 Tax=Marinovum algicola TaxID=42444 RepID=UPI003B52EB82